MLVGLCHIDSVSSSCQTYKNFAPLRLSRIRLRVVSWLGTCRLRVGSWGQQILPKHRYCLLEDWSSRQKPWAYSGYYFIFSSLYSHNRDVWTKMKLPEMLFLTVATKKIDRLPHWLTLWITNSRTHSVTHTHIHSLTHSLTHSHTHTQTHTHTHTHSLTHSLTHPIESSPPCKTAAR